MHDPVLPSARGTFLRKLAGAAAFVGLSDAVWWQIGLRGGAIGIVMLALALLVAAARPHVRRSKAPSAFLLLACVMAVALLVDPGFLALGLCMVFIALAVALPSARGWDDAASWAQRLAYVAALGIIEPLRMLRTVDRLRRRRPGARARVVQAAALIVMPLAGSAVFAALFVAANPVLSLWLRQIALPLPAPPRVAFWLVLGLGAISLLRPRCPRAVIALPRCRDDPAVFGVSPGSITLSLVLFNLVFALQNAMDAVWLWGHAALPTGTTLADYAHRGAYPLIATALLAALFVVVLLRPGSATARDRRVRWLVVVWIAQNVLLVAGAVRRTLAYVAAYSLTEWRIAALVWMTLVGCGLALVCWRLVFERSAAWLVNANAGVAATVMIAACFTDFGTLSADWNVRHARETGGQGAPLDMCYMQRLGPSALDALAVLAASRAPEPLRALARDLRRQAYARLRHDRDRGVWSLRASRQWAAMDMPPLPRQAPPVLVCGQH